MQIQVSQAFSHAIIPLHGDIHFQRTDVKLSLLMATRYLLSEQTNAGQCGAQMAVIRESSASEDLDGLAVRPDQESSLNSVVASKSNRRKGSKNDSRQVSFPKRLLCRVQVHHIRRALEIRNLFD